MDIAVIASPNSKQLTRVTYEAINAALDLDSNTKVKLSIWILGSDNSKALTEAAKLPIDQIHRFIPPPRLLPFH